ncbi:MAG: hypothetical protein CMN30_04525 [Sandaracinus sp.]|nr:hypothetical protein [Sandaracinus sp.]
MSDAPESEPVGPSPAGVAASSAQPGVPLVRRVTSRRANQIGLGLAFALGVGLVFNRLAGIPGIEGALALGAALPFLAAVLSARAVIRARREARAVGAGTLLLEAATRGFLLWAVPVLVLCLNMLRVRTCEPWVGLGYMVLGPAFGVMLTSLGSLALALLVRRFVTLAALVLPLGAVLWGLWEFWSTPAIFVYSHVVGWFPGTLYDVGRGFPFELLTFRGLTLCWMLAAVLGVLAIRPREGRPTRPRLRLTLPALGFLVLGALGAAQGPTLGHRSTVAAIDEALGARHWGERCVVHAPREVPAGEAWRLVRDCDFRVMQAERALGVTQSRKVHAFFYRNAVEKARWMGAGNTYIAKPWRDEVHLQLSTWPHPVLAHEVVHVVAGNAAQGPFRVSGQLGGWFPDAGLIEGIAVAVDWRESDGMDPHRWSRAMRDMDLLPPLRNLLGLRFMTQSARVAYSAAGSFTRFYLDTYGAEAMREAYRTGDFTEPVGKSLDALEAEWHEVLDAQELDAADLALAEVYFDRSSIFETTCPHRLAALKQRLGADLLAGDDVRARATCRDILDIDAGSAGTRAVLVGVLARSGDREAAQAELDELVGASRTLLAHAREGIADALWLRGESADALTIYRELLGEPQTEGAVRSLQVKQVAIEAGGREERILRDLFLGPTGGGVRPVSIVHFGHLVSGLREDGLGLYLAARQLVDASRYDLAHATLAQARRRGLPTPELEREALRLEGRAAFGAGDLDRSAALWTEARQDPALASEATEWLERIRWQRDR